MPTAPTTHHSQLGNTTLTLLEPALPTQQVLSVVPDINPGSASNQGGSLHLRAQHLLDAVGAPAALAAVLDDLEDAQRRTRTRLSFLWDKHGHVQRQTVDTQLHLDETSRYGPPDLEPLHFALESSARVLLAVIDDEWGRLLSVHLGEITELYRLENVLGITDTFRVHIVPEPDAHLLQSAAEQAPRNAPVQHQSAQQDGRFHHALLAQVQRLHQVGAFEQLLIGGSVRGRADFRAQLGADLQGSGGSGVAAPGDATAAALLRRHYSAWRISWKRPSSTRPWSAVCTAAHPPWKRCRRARWRNFLCLGTVRRSASGRTPPGMYSQTPRPWAPHRSLAAA